MPVIEIF